MSSSSLETAASGSSAAKSLANGNSADEKLKINPNRLTPQTRDLINEFDADGDGEIDLYELLDAMQALAHSRKTNKQMMRTIIGMIVLVALALASIFAVSIAATAILKDTKVKSSSDAAVMRSMSGKEDVQSIVRTAAVEPATSVAAESATPPGAIVSSSVPVEGLTSADAVPASVLNSGVAAAICESIAMASSAGFQFAVTFNFKQSKGVAMTIADNSLPLTVELAQPDESTSILHTRVIGKRVVDLAAANPAASGSVTVLDLEFVADSGRHARVCCTGAECMYAPGTAAPAAANEACSVSSPTGDLFCPEQTDPFSVGARDATNVAGSGVQKTSLKHYYLGAAPWTAFGNPALYTTGPVQTYEIPRATTMAAGVQWVCRNNPMQPILVAAYDRLVNNEKSYVWRNLKDTEQTPNAHWSLQDGSPTASLRSVFGTVSTFREFMTQANPICPSGTGPILEGYVTGAKFFYTVNGVASAPYDLGYLNSVWAANSGLAHGQTSSSSSPVVIDYELPIAICACRTLPSVGSVATRSAVGAESAAFRV